jgi:hypothetical protein
MMHALLAFSYRVKTPLLSRVIWVAEYVSPGETNNAKGKSSIRELGGQQTDKYR